MRRLCWIALCLVSIISCGTVQEVPVQTVEKIIYRDTTVFLKDTITVTVPVEKIVEVLPQLDTSYLSTSVAKSTAYLDTSSRKLHHTLEQKGTIKTKIDTVVTIQYVDRIMEKEVPIEVEVIKYKRDNIFWFSIIFNIMVILITAFKIYLKFRKL